MRLALLLLHLVAAPASRAARKWRAVLMALPREPTSPLAFSFAAAAALGASPALLDAARQLRHAAPRPPTRANQRSRASR